MKGNKRVADYRNQWKDLIRLVKETYNPLHEELRKQFKFEVFYLKVSGDYEALTGARVNQNSIVFSMGSHPNGIINTKKDERQQSTEAISESGGSLAFFTRPNW